MCIRDRVKPGSDLVVPKVRKAFPDTAYWNPTVHTGPDLSLIHI